MSATLFDREACEVCGPFIKYRRRTRAGEHPSARDHRGANELGRWVSLLDSVQEFDLWPLEGHALPIHRQHASIAGASR